MAIPRIGTKFARGVKAGFAPAISERFRRREGRDQFKIREAAADRDLLRQIKALKARSRASFNLTKDVAGFKEGQVLEAFATPGSKGKRAKLLGAGIDPVTAGILSPAQMEIRELEVEYQENRISLLEAQKKLAEIRGRELKKSGSDKSGRDLADSKLRNLLNLYDALEGGVEKGHKLFEFTDPLGDPASKVVETSTKEEDSPLRKNVLDLIRQKLGVEAVTPEQVPKTSSAPQMQNGVNIPKVYGRAFGQLIKIFPQVLTDVKAGKKTTSVAVMQNLIKMAEQGNKGANDIIDLLIETGYLKLDDIGSQQ